MSENEQNQNEKARKENGRSGLEGVDFAPGRERARTAAAEESAPASEAEAAAQGPEGTDGAAQENELDRARKEIEDLKESWSRERAEFANFRKRQIQEHSRSRLHAVSEFVQKLLPALDNLDRVLSAPTEDPAVKNFVIGVDMIRAEIVQILEREKIKAVKPQGEAFNPFEMEALATEDRQDIEKETVLEVFQPGYVLEATEGERQVLRPARVKVGKPARPRDSAPEARSESPAGGN